MTTPSNSFSNLPLELQEMIFLSAQQPRYIRMSHRFTTPAQAPAANTQHQTGSQAMTLEAVFHLRYPSHLQTCRASRQLVVRDYVLSFHTMRHGQAIRFNYALDTFYFESLRSITALNTQNGRPITSLSVQIELDLFKFNVRHLIIPDGLDPSIMDFVADFHHLETLMIEDTSAYQGFVSPSRYANVMLGLQTHWVFKRGVAPMPQVVFKTSAEIQALFS